MDVSSADFCKLTLQEVLDLLVDQDADGVQLAGIVDGQLCNVYVKLEVVGDDDGE